VFPLPLLPLGLDPRLVPLVQPQGEQLVFARAVESRLASVWRRHRGFLGD
jgi:hypothetical protein